MGGVKLSMTGAVCGGGGSVCVWGGETESARRDRSFPHSRLY